MFKKLLPFAAILILAFTAVLIFDKSFSAGEKAPLKPTGDSSLQQKGSHIVKFFDEQNFTNALSKTKDITTPNYVIRGGIIPHDLFASFIISGFFKGLSAQKPTNIILLGPNHYEKGNYKVLTSSYSWDTAFGNLAPDLASIHSLVGSGLAKIDEEDVPNDHSVAGIMPFIKYYLPDAKVTPLLLSSRMTEDDTRKLANRLAGLTTKETIIIASVDFSHYLNSSEAEEKDALTIQAIKDNNLKELFLFNSDHLDSPPAIATLLIAMQKGKTTTMEILNHTNSGKLQYNDSIETTSYFSIYFH